MKVLIAGFRQESNSFSIYYSGTDRYTILRGNDFYDKVKMSGRPLLGLLEVAEEAGMEIVPSVAYAAGSGGPVEPYVAEDFLREVFEDIDKAGHLDAIFLSLHGATDMKDHVDLCGYFLEKIRAKVGPTVVIVHSSDMHANITDKMMENSNACTGYNTYPHDDLEETGRRAARLGLRILRKEPFYEARVRIPMIIQAEAYDTNKGVFAELTNRCHKLVKDGKILDFSLFQMQPWLDLPDAASTVLVAAESKETAEKYAREIADELFSLRKEMELPLYDIDAVIKAARENTTGKPVILVDSADSPNAGSSADSTYVLEHLINAKVDFPCLLPIVDEKAMLQAFQTGVGNEADFTLGGSKEPNFQKPITIHAYVKSLHDSLYDRPGNPVGLQTNKQAAVLQVGTIYVVVMARMGNSADPRVFTGAGLDPALFRLLVVKSATQYKLNYDKWSDLHYPTDTPGSSSANLSKMPFRYLPRPFWPLDKIETFENKVVFYNE